MSGGLLCSRREAARVLGVGRNNTIADLIRRGVLRPVIVAGREYIPRMQLEALAANGETPSHAPAQIGQTAPKGKGRKKSPARDRGITRTRGSIADVKV